MENNNQRIIFLVPEDTTSAKIISDILEKNKVAKDTVEEILSGNKVSKVVTVNKAAKDFYDKKITEEGMSDLFQKELKVSKEAAAGIISGIKERLIPFAKKITIPSGEQAVKIPESLPTPASEIKFPGVEKEIIEEPKQIEKNIITEEPEAKVAAPVKRQTRIKKPVAAEETIKSAPQIRQSSGPDKYREPIE